MRLTGAGWANKNRPRTSNFASSGGALAPLRSRTNGGGSPSPIEISKRGQFLLAHRVTIVDQAGV